MKEERILCQYIFENALQYLIECFRANETSHDNF